LDYPALVAPVSKVLPTDVAETEYQPRNEQDRYNHQLCKCARGFEIDDLTDGVTLDDAVKYANAPVSIQLVGRRYEDEKVVEAMEYLQEELGLPWAEYV
jgi:Asp-tRNA(Asn)/Glu-tRNA(Gln) amidotransferase A subunit family amidase